MWGWGLIDRTVILEVVKRRVPHAEKMRWRRKGPDEGPCHPRLSWYLKVGI